MNIRDSRKPKHFWAYNSVADNHLPAIGAYGFALYMLLCRYANNDTGQCFPSIATLADKLDATEPTIRKYLSLLETEGLIAIKKRERDKSITGSCDKSSIYTIFELDEGVVNVVDQGGKPALPGVVNVVDPNNTNSSNNTQPNNSAPAPATPPPSAGVSFKEPGDETETTRSHEDETPKTPKSELQKFIEKSCYVQSASKTSVALLDAPIVVPLVGRYDAPNKLLASNPYYRDWIREVAVPHMKEAESNKGPAGFRHFVYFIRKLDGAGNTSFIAYEQRRKQEAVVQELQNGKVDNTPGVKIIEKPENTQTLDEILEELREWEKNDNPKRRL